MLRTVSNSFIGIFLGYRLILSFPTWLLCLFFSIVMAFFIYLEEISKVDRLVPFLRSPEGLGFISCLNTFEIKLTVID